MAKGIDYFLGGDQLALSDYFDEDGRWLPRLAYEGVADGVSTLDSNVQVEQPPNAASIANLSSIDAVSGEFLISKGGAVYRATGNAAGGPAILNANGKVISRLAYEGVADGVATLDANGIVAQAVLGQLKLAQVKYNSTDESTTATIGSVISALKSDEIALAANDIAVVTYGGVLSNYNGGWAFLHPMVSTDGGTNWNMAGTYSGVYGGGSSNKFYVSNVLLYPTASAQNVIFGVSYGNAAGQSDEIHWMSYKSLTVLVFGGQSS